MSDNCNIAHPLKREGTTQHERFPEALGEQYVKVDEQSIPDLVRLSHAYAKYVSYYPSDGTATIDWQPFFAEIKQIAEDPANYTNSVFDFAKLEALSFTKPHIALFFSFLRLFGFAQNNINTLGTKHLDFYYKEILQLKERPATPDKAALFFELEKNIANKKLDAGTIFKAGKDDTGKELYYKLAEDILVTPASVASVKNLFVNKNSISGKTISLHAAADELNAKEPWVSFGETGNPLADLGFMLASPALDLHEGNRVITVQVRNLPQLPAGSLTAEFTGAKKWEAVTSVVSAFGSITITLNDKCPAIAAYNTLVHKGGYSTSSPVLKITLNKTVVSGTNTLANECAYDFFKNLSVSSADFTLKISVTGVRKLMVESDNGSLETAKPLFPFGATPVVGSCFYVGYPLAFNKYLQSFQLHYNLLQPATSNIISTFAVANKIDFSQKELMLGAPDAQKVSFKDDMANKVLHGKLVKAIDQVSAFFNQYSFADVYSLNNKVWNGLNTKAFRTGVSVSQNGGKFTNDIPAEITSLAPGLDGGFIKLSLTDASLDYEKYIKDFTAAVIAKTTPPTKPDAPKISDLSLDYTLQLNFSDLEVFHLHPFGFEEINDLTKKVLPVFADEGNLYIGISNFNLPGLINLYFQLQEDSGDVNKTIQKISWYSLRGNNWNKLEAQQILRDSTQGLTQSGILSFNIVELSADNNHTILDNGMVWLRASVPYDSGAYPKIISIKSQAAIATFNDEDNDPAHLRSPLAAGKITKFLEKPDGIKSVSQPFESFGGKMKEESKSFYTRISERLRHKQRTWNIWDYERMILENFPFVYKTKCISHTTEQTEFAPGHATIIVIPNLVNTATYNKLEPRVSVGNLQKINEFISRYKSPFAKIKVINPVYEKIRVETDLVLHPQFNDEYYAGELRRMITEYLAPWINNDPVKLSFNGTIHRSSIINLLDESDYVDYVSDFKMIKLKSSEPDSAPGIRGDEFAPDMECNILTSAGTHIIHIDRPC